MSNRKRIDSNTTYFNTSIKNICDNHDASIDPIFKKVKKISNEMKEIKEHNIKFINEVEEKIRKLKLHSDEDIEDMIERNKNNTCNIYKNLDDKIDKVITGNTSNLDSFYENIDFIQLQINNMQFKFDEIEKDVCEIDCVKNNIKTLKCDINKFIYDKLNSIDICIEDNKSAQSSSLSYYFDDPNVMYVMRILCDNIYLNYTLIGGGGAGGIGFIFNSFMFNGGGGGCSGYLHGFYKPSKGDILKIKVGKGMDALSNYNESYTIVEILKSNGQLVKLISYSGKNGYPDINTLLQVIGGIDDINIEDINVNGGNGGGNNINSINGMANSNGNPGSISIPSVINSSTGSGGNFISTLGGAGGDADNMHGCDGILGSGGGGAIANLIISSLTTDDNTLIDILDKIKSIKTLSGNGGNGFASINIVSHYKNINDAICIENIS